MNEMIKKNLEQANKLIFVKSYEKAYDILNAILNTEVGEYNLLVHLRKIELSIKLQFIQDVRKGYLNKIKDDEEHSEVWQICLAYCDQQSENVSTDESIYQFQAIMEKYGVSAAAFYGLGFSLEIKEDFQRAIYNYEEALKLDRDWFPAYFGLSQVYYQLDQEEKGDQYFYMFEQASPYNLYGNFETHKTLSKDFLDDGYYDESIQAIESLCDWWVGNKGSCPVELRIFQYLVTSKVMEDKGDVASSDKFKKRAILLSKEALTNSTSKESVLYFIAKVLEEYSEFDLAVEFYRSILNREDANSSLIQKIGSQFLSMGEYELAHELFEGAYEKNAENKEVRFCRLVSGLRLAKVDVEEYLVGKEKLEKLIDSPEDKVELLALLHSMMAKYKNDHEVHGHMADVYLSLNNIDRAESHYNIMYDLDPFSRYTAMKYASFLMYYGDANKAIEVLGKVKVSENDSNEFREEVKWLYVNYYMRQKNFEEALKLISSVIEFDPWNVAYVIQEILCLSNMLVEDKDLALDESILTLSKDMETEIDWQEYDSTTQKLAKKQYNRLVYARQKIRFLYSSISYDDLLKTVNSACVFDGARGIYDFLRLLNTNFDSPQIYMALGILAKSLWQLETAIMWFEQLLMQPSVDEDIVSQVYLELADCYAWKNINLDKAVELAKFSIDIKSKDSENVHVLYGNRAALTLAHAYLKSGQVSNAKVFLDQASNEQSHDFKYLKGLYEYRNGHPTKANEIWKPLLTTASQDMRLHNIKQMVLKYYFENEPYLQAQ